MLDKIRTDSANAVREIIERAGLKSGALLVIGCSTSEIHGGVIGKQPSPELANAVLDGILSVTDVCGINIAAQCCEHLNRALVIDREAVTKNISEEVCVRPRAHAGGSFATAYYEHLADPVVLESVSADAALDIGETLIGMHLRPVAVPLRLEVREIGKARVTAAYSRAKLIGGARADYP